VLRTMARRIAHPELRLAMLTLLLPLYFAVALSTNYIGALHAPRPHDVEVAIVGAPSTTAPLAHGFSVRAKNAFSVSQLSSVLEARRLVSDRKLAGAFLPSPDRPTVIVATAASASLANFVEATFREVAAAQDHALTVDDVRPLPPNNPSGEPNFFFIVVCTLGGFLTIVALGFAAPTLPEYHRLAVTAIASVLAPVIAYLIGGPGYDTFSGSFGTIIAMLGMGALYAFTVAVITRLMQLGLGVSGTLLGSLVLIFMNFPSSGGSVAGQLLPGFWRFLNHFWIGADALEANRCILYFGGAGVGSDVLEMLAWVAAWAAILALPIYLRSNKRRLHADAVPASPAVATEAA
jgi:hypothetical protein